MHWGDIVKSKVTSISPLVIGIDPNPAHAPDVLSGDRAGFLERYTLALLDAGQGKVGFVKFQTAYFEAWGCDGISSLARSVAITRDLEADCLTIRACCRLN